MVIRAISHKILDIDRLKQHEQTDKKHLEKLTKQIARSRYVTPILVDEESKVILDGHHRLNALKDLGYKQIPAFSVDYFNSNVKVVSRRPEFKVTKKEIVKRGLAGNPYPPKTTKHGLDSTEPRISLKQLRYKKWKTY